LTLLAGGLLTVLGQADKLGVGGEECLYSKRCSIWLLAIGMVNVKGGEMFWLITR
jgi:hypothetical protein